MTTFVTVLNNAKSSRYAGNPALANEIQMHPGATEISAELFERAVSGDGNDCDALRALMKAGTICVIDASTPPSAAEISKMTFKELEIAANKFGASDTRARLSQRYWLACEEYVPSGLGHLFTSPNPNVDVSPRDLDNGWKSFERKQRPLDKQLANAHRQQQERRAAEQRNEDLLIALRAAAQKAG